MIFVQTIIQKVFLASPFLSQLKTQNLAEAEMRAFTVATKHLLSSGMLKDIIERQNGVWETGEETNFWPGGSIFSNEGAIYIDLLPKEEISFFSPEETVLIKEIIGSLYHSVLVIEIGHHDDSYDIALKFIDIILNNYGGCLILDFISEDYFSKTILDKYKQFNLNPHFFTY